MGGPGGTANSFTQWQQLPPYGIGQPGAVESGGTPEPSYRNLMDERRSMYRRTPSSEYPDGYLGTITGRQQDKVLDSLKGRQNQRSYQRGVHKGERIDPGDYYWPDQWRPDRQMRAQAMAVPIDGGTTFLTPRSAPLGSIAPKLTPERVFDPHSMGYVEETSGIQRRDAMRRLGPSWRF
jgi:hypothetical protein